MREIFKNKSVVILLSLIFLGMLVLNFYVPLMQDDLYNDFIFNGEGRIKNIKDFFYSNYQFYIGWTGRLFYIFFSQLFALLPKVFFNFINSLAIIFMIIGIYINIDKKSREGKIFFTLIIIFVLFWFGAPMFGEAVMWMSGAIAYMWSVTYLLFFVYFFKNIFSEKESYRIKYKIFIIVFALIGGVINEVWVSSIFIASLLYIIFNKKNHNKFGLIYLGTFFIGLVITALAPGNYARWLTCPPVEFKEKIINYFQVLIQMIVITKVIFIPLIFIIIFLAVTRKKKFYKIIKSQWYYLLIAIISAGAIIVPPIITRRTFLGSAIFLIIVTVNLILQIVEKQKVLLISIIISGLLVLSYFFLLKDYIILNKQIKNREGICYYYQGMMPLNYKPYITKFLVADSWKPGAQIIPVDNMLPAIIEKKNGTGDSICFLN